MERGALPFEYENSEEREFRDQVCRLADYLEDHRILSEFHSHLRLQLRELFDLLVHSSKCDGSFLSSHFSLLCCQFPKCSKGKALYHHVFMCTQSVCKLCKSMVRLVKFHTIACKQSNCTVPRCREMKEHNLKSVQRLRAKEGELRCLQQQLQFMRKSGGGGEEMRSLKAEIRAEKERFCMLKFQIWGKVGYELIKLQCKEQERIQRGRLHLHLQGVDIIMAEVVKGGHKKRGSEEKRKKREMERDEDDDPLCRLEIMVYSPFGL